MPALWSRRSRRTGLADARGVGVPHAAVGAVSFTDGGIRIRAARAEFPSREAHRQAVELTAHLILQLRDIGYQFYREMAALADLLAEQVKIGTRPTAARTRAGCDPRATELERNASLGVIFVLMLGCSFQSPGQKFFEEARRVSRQSEEELQKSHVCVAQGDWQCAN